MDLRRFTLEDFEKTPKTSENTTKVYKEETITRSKSKSSLVKFNRVDSYHLR